VSEVRTDLDTAQALQFLGATENESVDRHHNAPTSLSASDDETLEAARVAWAGQKKRTFEGWITIGKGIRILRRRADHIGGRKTFHRLLAEQGFRVDGPKLERQFDKTTATRLLQVMEQETEVRIWHQQLTPVQQAEWASPNAILRHCPLFAKPEKNREGKPSAYAQLKATNVELQEQLNSSLTENRELRAANDGGNLFTAESSAEHIADAVASLIRTSPSKIRDVATYLNKRAKEYEARIKTARPKREKRR
jgi:hypothetical protein